jgi:hypothetical protein
MNFETTPLGDMSNANRSNQEFSQLYALARQCQAEDLAAKRKGPGHSPGPLLSRVEQLTLW